MNFQVLYLIGYAVQEQRTGHYPFFQFYERAVKWNILQLLEELIGETRVSIIKLMTHHV